MGKQRRRRFTAAFKAKVALAAIRGEKTLSELAGQYQVHPTQIGQWRRQALEGLAEVFSTQRQRDRQRQAELVEQLYQQIGRLKVELDWLKKKSGLEP